VLVQIAKINCFYKKEATISQITKICTLIEWFQGYCEKLKLFSNIVRDSENSLHLKSQQINSPKLEMLKFNLHKFCVYDCTFIVGMKALSKLECIEFQGTFFSIHKKLFKNFKC
jgi:hypothetical protein